MKSMSLFNRAAMASALVFTGIAGSIGLASAEDTAPWLDMDFEPDAFKSEISDFDVETDGKDFEITAAQNSEYDGGQGELVVIESESAIYEVDIFKDDYSAEDDITLWASDLTENYESVEILDSDFESEDGGWALYEVIDEAEFGDEPAYWFVTVQTDVDGDIDLMESVFAFDSTFLDDIEAGQENISVGGDDFMADVDVDDVEDMMGGGSSQDDATNDDNEDEEDGTPESGR